MTINKTTQFSTNPDSIPISTDLGTDALSSSVQSRLPIFQSKSEMESNTTVNYIDGQIVFVRGDGFYKWSATLSKFVRTNEDGNFKATEFANLNSIHETDGSYTAWPFSNLFFDSSDNSINQIYSAGTDHLTTDGIVYIRKMIESGEMSWSGRVVVADRNSENFIATCHAASIMPNGDYVAFVRFKSTGAAATENYIYRSTDKGSTWSGSQWLDNTSSVIVLADATNDLGAPHGMYVADNGTILVYAWDHVNSEIEIYRSTSTSGANATYTLVDTIINSTGIDGVPIEGQFLRDPDTGDFVVISRRSQFSSVTNPKTLLYSTSSDDGITWADFQYTDISTSQQSPVAILEYPEYRIAEVFWTDRAAHPQDGFGSIYQSVVTYDELFSGTLSGEVRIGIGPPNLDFGYVAATKSSSDKVYLSYYGGNDKWTSIYFKTGDRRSKLKSKPNNDIIARSAIDGELYRDSGYLIKEDGRVVIWKKVQKDFNVEITKYTLPIIFEGDPVTLAGISVTATPAELGSTDRQAFQSHVVFMDFSVNDEVVLVLTEPVASSSIRDVLLRVEGSLYIV